MATALVMLFTEIQHASILSDHITLLLKKQN